MHWIQWLAYGIGALLLGTMALAAASAAPWLPTRKKQREALLAALPDLGGMTVVDLGCGDGGLLFDIARRYPAARCVGYDLALLPLLLGWAKKMSAPRAYRNVSLRYGNLFNQSVADADFVFVFLLDKAYPRLIEKFSRELKPSARVIVEAWPFEKINPASVSRMPGLLPFYFYDGTDFKGTGK